MAYFPSVQRDKKTSNLMPNLREETVSKKNHSWRSCLIWSWNITLGSESVSKSEYIVWSSRFWLWGTKLYIVYTCATLMKTSVLIRGGRMKRPGSKSLPLKGLWGSKQERLIHCSESAKGNFLFSVFALTLCWILHILLPSS